MAAFIWGIGIRRLIDAIRRENGARRRLWPAAEPQVVVSAEDQVLVGVEHGRLGQALAGLSPELALTSLAMRDQWHRYTRSLPRLPLRRATPRKQPHSA